MQLGMIGLGRMGANISPLRPARRGPEGVPVPVLSAALYERFSSRGESHYADQLLSAMRQQFGGHAELPTMPA
jgi:6-phosphogluconate dehydrogenase (decarboxylating)